MFNLFNRKRKEQKTCDHHWVITFLDVDVDHMVGGTITTVYRICKYCHHKENNWVRGEIDKSTAYDIYGNHKRV